MNRGPYIRHALQIYHEIEKYCEKYNEWPKQVKSIKTEKDELSRKLCGWLYSSGYLNGEFKYKDMKTENGKMILEELKKLQKKYDTTFSKDKKVALKWLKKIRLYCEKYNEFPSVKKDHTKEQNKEANRLLNWLSTAGYFNNKFRYGNILTDSSLTIKEELDKLCIKYKKKRNKYCKRKDTYVKRSLKMFQEIKKYCEAYNEFPTIRKDHTEEQNREAIRLTTWLRRICYYKGDFLFADVLTESGLTLKEELDKLYIQYKKKKKLCNKPINRSINVKYVLQMFDEIKDYCEKYNEFPSNCGNKNVLSTRLYKFLYNSGYINGEFKYKDVKTKDGKFIEEEIDNLYCLYKEKDNKKKEEKRRKYILDMFKKLKTYCITYQEWPIYSHNPKTEKERDAKQLSSWLYRCGFMNDEFKYKDLKTDEGKKIVDEMSQLYNYYKAFNMSYAEQRIIKMVLKLKLYCETYKEWPRRISPIETEEQKISNNLYHNLWSSGYINGQFKYSDIKINGVSIKTILDYYYFMYGVKDIWSAKDSYDIASTAYYYILNIWKEKEKNNDSMVKYYYDSLKTKLKNRFSDFNIDEIMEILNQDIDIISEYFLQKYLTYSIANDTWIYFYKSLYEYSLYKKENTLKL